MKDGRRGLPAGLGEYEFVSRQRFCRAIYSVVAVPLMLANVGNVTKQFLSGFSINLTKLFSLSDLSGI